MSTRLRRTIRDVKFAVSPFVRNRLSKITKEIVIERLSGKLETIHKQINAIEGKQGMESRRGKLITQTFGLQKRLIALRKRAK